jgi:adenine phosphoribosyltransferase
MTAPDDLAVRISGLLRDVPDFPEPGVIFKDIAPLLADGTVFREAMTAMGDAALALGPVDLIAGIEARGFIIAAALAQHLGCGMLPIRKAGKLPPPTVRRVYDLEYGTAEIEVPVGLIEGRRVYIVDDVLATGGTGSAAVALITEAGGTVTGLGVLMELTFLAGRAKLGDLPLHTLLSI